MSQTIIPYATPERHGLTARDVFGVIVRTAGLLLLIWGAYTLVYLIGAAVTRAPMGGQPPGSFLLLAAFCGSVGLALLKGEWLVRAAYGPERP